MHDRNPSQYSLSRGEKTDTNSRRTILIVDDNAVERTVLSGYLKEHYDIVAADSGMNAISILEKEWEHIAAIVLDIIMPEMDGYEVMQRLRSTAVFSHIQCLSLYAKTERFTSSASLVVPVLLCL